MIPSTVKLQVPSAEDVSSPLAGVSLVAVSFVCA
jgi:hypothetical protein